eukprot:TRINITY_DN29740_c0_g1_i1.p1 TRINITY_DN29740_c0_g1~~TRINITY_DN29740_c0_g1_i1.p1  ORF type:complete len:253 (+),score=82.85 TRINITY_DN29740_c0_g1_i1:42-800(+)
MSPKEKTRIDHIASLKRDLFKNYDKEVIPMMKEDEPVNLAVSPTVIYMDMDDKGVINLHMWVRLMWKDERLAWNPEEYGGVGQLNLPNSKIWMPDVICFNGLNPEATGLDKAFDSGRRQTPVLVYASGDCTIVTSSMEVKVQCTDEEFANWPWGEYDAKVTFGSWTYKGREIKLSAGEGSWSFDNSNMVPNSPFYITVNSFKSDPLDVKTYGTEDEYMSLDYKFKVQRRYRITETGKESNPDPVPEFKPTQQ